MGSLSERLALIIDWKGDAGIKGLENVAKKSESADESTRSLSDKLTKMGATGLAASGVAAIGLSKLAMGASDVNEVVSKSRVLFGDAADGVIEFAEGAAKSMGQSKVAALEAATTFANLGRATGLSGQGLSDFSTKLTGLASDLASFNNTSPEEAVMALGAALRGESEPIRQFGVMLDEATLKQRALEMGLISTTSGTLPPAIKMQAAYAEIMAQTSAAQGDFARTSDGAANQQRILKAEIKNLADGIGAGLLPAFQGAVHGAASVVGKLNELSPAAKGAIGTLAAGGLGVTAAVSGISLIAGQLAKLKERMVDTSEGGLNLTGKFAVGAAIGVGTLTTALGLLQLSADRSKENLTKLQAKMAETGLTAEKAASRQLIEWVSKNEAAAKALKNHKISNEDLIAVMEGDKDARKRVNDALDKEIVNRETWIGTTRKESVAAGELQRVIRDLLEAQKDQAKEEKAKADAIAATTEKTEMYSGSLSTQRRYLLDNADATEEYAKAVEREKLVQENAERATQELTKALDDQKKKNDDLYTSFLTAWSGQNINLPKAIDDVKTALLDYYAASKEAEEATKKYGAESEEAQRAQLKFNEAGRGGYEAIQNYARVALETEAARRGISVDALDASEKVAIQKEALNKLKEKVPEYTGAIDQVASSMDGVANSMDTAAGKTEDAAKRIAAATAALRDQVVGHFNEIRDSVTGLSTIVTTADQAERVIQGAASYEKRNGPGWRT